jgi:hypothetical protein
VSNRKRSREEEEEISASLVYSGKNSAKTKTSKKSILLFEFLDSENSVNGRRC